MKLHHIEFMCFESGTAHWDLKFKGWVSAGSPLKGYNPNLDADFTFFVEWESEQMDTFSPMGELSVGVFEIFPQDDVVSLSLLSYDDIPFNRHFARKISQLPASNALHLSYISSALFLQEFDCGAPREGDDPSIPTYPALRYLDFSDHQLDIPGLTTLYNCLKKRSELGLGPEKLKINLHALRNLDKQTTALLEKVVEVVSRSSQ